MVESVRRARSSAAKRCAVGLSVLVAIAGSTAVAEAHGPLSRTSDTTPNSVATTAPAEITPPSGAGTSGPTTTATGAGSDQPATISTVGVVVGIAGVTILLGGAAWWMVRREDEDEAPHPPRPSSSTDLT